jgi:hypothetical protein
MHKVIGLFLLGSIGLFAACGGGNATPQNPPPEGSASAAPSSSAAPSASTTAEAPTGKPWDAMSHAERLEQMKTVVLPKLQADFQAFNAKKYEKFSCTTCHGERIKQGNFTMPNPDLPKLSMADFKKYMDTKPEITKFMMSKVEPDTAAAINLKPFDPQTKTGFGCGGCHVVSQ